MNEPYSVELCADELVLAHKKLALAQRDLDYWLNQLRMIRQDELDSAEVERERVMRGNK